VELGDDASYHVRRISYISFQMPSCDVLELSDVLFVPSLMRNLLSMSSMEKVQWRVAFDGQQCTISDCSLAIPRTIVGGVREGGPPCYLLI
jgi:hypothetical protein